MLWREYTDWYLQSLNLRQSSVCVYLAYFYCDVQQFDNLSLNGLGCCAVAVDYACFQGDLDFGGL